MNRLELSHLSFVLEAFLASRDSSDLRSILSRFNNHEEYSKEFKDVISLISNFNRNFDYENSSKSDRIKKLRNQILHSNHGEQLMDTFKWVEDLARN